MWFFSRDPLKDFGYEIGEVVSEFEGKSIWSLHEGTKKVNGDKVSVFVFESKPENEHHLVLAKSAFKRIKTLRHPNFIVYLDGLETEKSCYIVTERLSTLTNHIKNHLASSSDLVQKHAVSWGLHQTAKALNFLVKDCSISHNNINIWSIFVDQAGEWKLGGLEYALTSSSTCPAKGLRFLEKYDPPEKNTSRHTEKWSGDMWGLGCLIWEVFNGEFHNNSALKEPEKIPKDLVKLYCQLVGANPRSRPSPSKFIEVASTGFFNNDFVKSMQFIEEIQIKDAQSKNEFFSSLADLCDDFPQMACKLKILPRLREALEFGGDPTPSILNPLFKLGKLLTTEEFQQNMVGIIVKLFSSPDRCTRVKLLQQMEIFAQHLPPAVVNQQIFPSIVTGFHDSNPVVREQTVKSMLYMASKLDYKNLNEELMKHFARLQSKDAQGGIRTNTTICLGKIACYLHPQVRQKVLFSAFNRACKDPFPASRQAAIMGFGATQRFFSINDSASRILPSLCLLTTDPDKTVRDQVFKTMKAYLSRLEVLSEDPNKREEMEKDVNSGGTGMVDVAGWAGWAVSGVTSITSKLIQSDKSKKTASKVSELKTVPSEVKNEPATKKEFVSGDGKKEEKKKEEESKEVNDGWDEWGDIEGDQSEAVLDDDEEDWGSLEANNNDRDEAEMKFVAVTDHKTTSSYQWASDDKDDFFNDNALSDWNNDSWGTDSTPKNKSKHHNNNNLSLKATTDTTNKKPSSSKLPLKNTPINDNSRLLGAQKETVISSKKPLNTAPKKPLKLKSDPEPDFFAEGW